MASLVNWTKHLENRYYNYIQTFQEIEEEKKNFLPFPIFLLGQQYPDTKIR